MKILGHIVTREGTALAVTGPWHSIWRRGGREGGEGEGEGGGRKGGRIRGPRITHIDKTLTLIMTSLTYC